MIFFSLGGKITAAWQLDEKALKPHLDAMPSIRTKRYYGVSFENRTLGAKKWRCQIMRQGLVIFLGAYVTAEEAARAYDNASFYLANWSEQIPRYNFPSEWTVADPPKISVYSARALAKLKERFPNWE